MQNGISVSLVRIGHVAATYLRLTCIFAAITVVTFGAYQIAAPQLNISYLIYSASKLQQDKLAVVIPQLLNVRLGPSMSYPVLSVIPKNAVVEIVDVKLPWVKIRVKGDHDTTITGYVIGDFIGAVECQIFEGASRRKITVSTTQQCHALGGISIP